MATPNELQRQIATLEARLRDLEADNVSRPSRYPDVGAAIATKFVLVRQVDNDSDIFVWVEDVTRGPKFADPTISGDFGRYLAMSERNETAAADEQYQMTVDAHLIAKAYSKFVWIGDTTKRSPLLVAQFIRDNWIVRHPFYGVEVLTFAGDVVIDDCTVEGVI